VANPQSSSGSLPQFVPLTSFEGSTQPATLSRAGGDAGPTGLDRRSAALYYNPDGESLLPAVPSMGKAGPLAADTKEGAEGSVSEARVANCHSTPKNTAKNKTSSQWVLKRDDRQQARATQVTRRPEFDPMTPMPTLVPGAPKGSVTPSHAAAAT
jgi:hypothetical protein